MIRPHGALQGTLGFVSRRESCEEPSLGIESIHEDMRIWSTLLHRAQSACDHHGLDRAIGELVEQLGGEETLLVFTSFVDAARGLFSRLARRGGAGARIGLLTGGGAEATGLGRTSSTDILSRFSPLSQGLTSSPFPWHQRLQVLIATDCLSEGVDLHDCGRVVLADLPYTPLSVEQRIGRLLRAGGPHERVEVYVPRPSNWPDSLGMRRRLNQRLDIARESNLPFVGAEVLSSGERGPVRRSEDLLSSHDRLDRLASTITPIPLSSPDEDVCHVPSLGWIRVRPRSAGLPRGLFCVVARWVGERLHPVWLWRGREGEWRSGVRMGVELVVRLMDSDEEMEEISSPPAHLVEEASSHIRQISSTLRAAHAAPLPLSPQSAAVLIWERLLDHDPDLVRDEIFMQALLRPHPLGIERILQGYRDDEESSPAHMLQQLREILASTTHQEPSCHIEWLWGIWIEP